MWLKIEMRMILLCNSLLFLAALYKKWIFGARSFILVSFLKIGVTEICYLWLCYIKTLYNYPQVYIKSFSLVLIIVLNEALVRPLTEVSRKLSQSALSLIRLYCYCRALSNFFLSNGSRVRNGNYWEGGWFL